MPMSPGNLPGGVSNAGIAAADGILGQDWSDDRFQDYLLQGVSRTFALTIPELPGVLASVVSNGYLLCRIIDTIEDETGLSLESKRYFCGLFPEVVAGGIDAQRFSSELLPLLSESTPERERELIALSPRVIRITHGFRPSQRTALETCVRVMALGMADFQEHKDPSGLATLEDMERYCYHVAGVVGELLTRLFCDYSPEIAQRESTLMLLAVYFGQGLQMTNILKDIWEDRRRGSCWLPRDVFAQFGFDLGNLESGGDREAFSRGLGHLIAIANARLQDALQYTLLIPSRETGLRNFCLWAIGMAMLTLRKIDRNRHFRAGREVKITRRSVKATVIASRFSARHDFLLRGLFRVVGAGLPRISECAEQATPPGHVRRLG
jgi:farnesyl-diphosphate farnesyltransferase